MGTWKKVYTTGDDILVADGGTGADSFTSGAAITSSTGITTLGLATSKLMVGTGGAPTAGTVGGDLTVSGTTTLNFQIIENAVDATALGDGTVLWEQHMKDDGSSYQNYMPTYNASGVATMLAPPSSSGQVLSFDGSDIVWDAPSGSSTVDVGNAASTAGTLPIVVESATNTLGVDSGAFNYTPSTETLAVTNATISGTLTATASAASTVTLQDGNAQNSASPILFSNGTSDSGTGVGIMADVSDLNYNASTATLTVKNLTVDGTTTTLDVNTLEVDDANITMAKNAGTQADAAAAGLSPAIRVYVTKAAGGAMSETLYPQLSYAGSASTVTATGWKVTKNTSDTTSVTTGIAAMDYEDIAGNTAMDNVNTTSADIGVGAFKLCGTELWIQTA